MRGTGMAVEVASAWRVNYHSVDFIHFDEDESLTYQNYFLINEQKFQFDKLKDRKKIFSADFLPDPSCLGHG